MNNRRKITFMLITANIILSLYLALTEYFRVDGICFTGNSCSIVENSAYATLAGIKLSWLGVIAFMVLMIVFLLVHQKKIQSNLLLWTCILGALFASYFLYLQFFVIKAVCSTCLLIDSFMFVILLFEIYEFVYEEKGGNNGQK